VRSSPFYTGKKMSFWAEVARQFSLERGESYSAGSCKRRMKEQEKERREQKKGQDEGT